MFLHSLVVLRSRVASTEQFGTLEVKVNFQLSLQCMTDLGAVVFFLFVEFFELARNAGSEGTNYSRLLKSDQL